MSNEQSEKKIVFEVRELSHEEIVECAREGRRLRREMQKEIDGTRHISSEAWNFHVD